MLAKQCKPISLRSGNGWLFNLTKQIYEKKLLVAFPYSPAEYEETIIAYETNLRIALRRVPATKRAWVFPGADQC